MKKKILNIDAVHQCNCCMGHKTLYPLVSVIDLSKAPPEQRTVRCDSHTITLIEGEAEYLTYGRKYYNYPDASLIFRIPREAMKLDTDNMLARKGQLLAFRPDLIACTTLESHIKDYPFFSYKLNESLYLSLREKMRIIECIRNIEGEFQYAIGCHNKILISRHVELLLDYCTRFNKRQFIIRCEANKIILHKTDLLSSKYILSGKLIDGIPPIEEYCADAFHLSPRYSSDLLKFETGKSIYEYFQLMQLNIAKGMLLGKDNTVHMTAKKLGYANVRYFTLLFEKITGTTPAKYKYTQNRNKSLYDLSQ